MFVTETITEFHSTKSFIYSDIKTWVTQKQRAFQFEQQAWQHGHETNNNIRGRLEFKVVLHS